jgi:hypothetical protein
MAVRLEADLGAFAGVSRRVSRKQAMPSCYVAPHPPAARVPPSARSRGGGWGEGPSRLVSTRIFLRNHRAISPRRPAW